MMFATFSRPRRVFPMNCKAETKAPTAGDLALQLASGVLTTRLQLVSNEESTYCRGSSTIENIPDPFVVALETIFPLHCNCTRASEEKDSTAFT